LNPLLVEALHALVAAREQAATARRILEGSFGGNGWRAALDEVNKADAAHLMAAHRVANIWRELSRVGLEEKP
jgi:hypothetical protein